MAHRKTLPLRPWIKNTAYDLLSSNNVLHYDIKAYVDIRGGYWFRILASQGGTRKQGDSVYEYNHAFGLLYERDPFEFSKMTLAEVKWTKPRNGAFRQMHKFLLGMCIALPGYNRASVLCHYVNVPDQDPWPRTMQNGYKYTVRPDDPRRRKGKRVSRAMHGALEYARATGKLPDLL